MKIALAHFRVGETDGVSLEMAKWRAALEKLGHEVVYLSGSRDGSEIYVPGLEYDNPRNLEIHRQAFVSDSDPVLLEKEITDYAAELSKNLVSAIENHGIDLIVPNNLLSLGYNLALGMALMEATRKTNIKVITHHHDFHWERERYSAPTHPLVTSLLDQYFPPREGVAKHAVINNIAREAMQERAGLDATVVPNVFDFQQEPWVVDEYNGHLRQDLGIGENDIVVLQATRVTERKAIELAIRVVGYLNRQRERIHGSLYDGRVFGAHDRIVLLMAGLVEAETSYVDYLTEVAKEENVELVWGTDLIRATREQKDSKRYYSLWDSYAIADVVTYPSILEGWGNQFLEAVFAQKPIIVYEYPVFLQDIKPLKFKVGTLGSTHTQNSHGYVEVSGEQIDSAGEQALQYLTNKMVREDAVLTNFAIGKEHFSYQALESILEGLLREV